jgi:hypothetical protein
MDNETRRAIGEICDEMVARLGRVAGDAHGVRVTLWCSSNDPGWKFSVEVP